MKSTWVHKLIFPSSLYSHLYKIKYITIRKWHNFAAIWHPEHLLRPLINSMERSDYMLAVLASAKEADYSPIQLQKLFFLLDAKLGKSLKGPYYKFTPYHYGPFDSSVYTDLDGLEEGGFIEKKAEVGLKKYKLTEEGFNKGYGLFSDFNDENKNFIIRINEFVRSLSFSQLINAIYKEYPEMKKNSIFRS